MSLRGVVRSVTDLSIIAFLGLVFVLGLTLKTLFELLKRKFPRVHAVGVKIKDRFRKPV